MIPLKAVINLVGGHYYGIHAIYNTDDIESFNTIAENADAYIRFVEKFAEQ